MPGLKEQYSRQAYRALRNLECRIYYYENFLISHKRIVEVKERLKILYKVKKYILENKMEEIYLSQFKEIHFPKITKYR